MGLIKLMQVKNKMAMENGDTWRLWGPLKQNSYVKWNRPLAISNLWEA